MSEPPITNPRAKGRALEEARARAAHATGDTVAFAALQRVRDAAFARGEMRRSRREQLRKMTLAAQQRTARDAAAELSAATSGDIGKHEGDFQGNPHELDHLKNVDGAWLLVPSALHGKRTSGARRSRRDPARIGSVLSSLLREQGWDERTQAAQIPLKWDTIVGELIASNTVIEGFSDGKLIIRARSTAWALQLEALIPVIERRIIDIVGDGVVQKITVLAPSGPSWKHGKFRVRGGRGPRDTYG